MTVRVRDRGARRVVQALRSRGHVDVGVLGPKSQEEHQGAQMTVADIAAVHEFGTDRIPRRSWLSGYIDANQKEIKRVMRVLARKVEKGRMTLREAHATLGVSIQGQIQARIAQNIPPPLAESTIARKGSSVALIDTGQLRSAITHRVEG